MTELLMQLKAFLLWTLLLVPPFALTALNLWNLFAECSGRRKLAPRLFAGLSMGIGAAEYFLLLCAWLEYSGKDYDQATYAFQTHNLIDSAHALSFWLPVLVGIVGLVLLLWCRPEQLPPLVSAGAVAGVLVGNIMQILLAVQIAGQVDLHRFLDWYFFITAICCCCLRWGSAGISSDRQGFCGNGRRYSGGVGCFGCISF